MNSEAILKRDLIALLPRLRRYALSLTRSASDADDLVQETCWRALNSAARWDPGQDLARWVFRIARNIWISETRKIRVRLGEGQVDAETAPELVSPGEAESRIAAHQLHQRVRDLPENLATVLLLVSVEGYSYQEAADHLDIPIGTVMSRIARARSRLRQTLDALEECP